MIIERVEPLSTVDTSSHYNVHITRTACTFSQNNIIIHSNKKYLAYFCENNCKQSCSVTNDDHLLSLREE